jgi:predicted HicB family RNase H-like nuclease
MTENKIAIRIPKDQHKAAKLKALQEDVTLSDVIREFLNRWVAGEIELAKTGKETEET